MNIIGGAVPAFQKRWLLWNWESSSLQLLELIWKLNILFFQHKWFGLSLFLNLSFIAQTFWLLLLLLRFDLLLMICSIDADQWISYSSRTLDCVLLKYLLSLQSIFQSLLGKWLALRADCFVLDWSTLTWFRASWTLRPASDIHGQILLIGVRCLHLCWINLVSSWN